ncbi:MAG: ABC transporter permease [Acidobacteria bacterium]|nr:ABC transporter permease [Acidobacteriota bacterium]
MRARYRQLEAATTGPAIAVSVEIENRSGAEWHSSKGQHIGWQVYDPETHRFLTEGEWVPLDVNVAPGARQRIEAELTLPPQDGPYRVYLSPVDDKNGWFYTDGGPFVVIDARMNGGRAEVAEASITTLGALRRRGLARALPRLFRQPFESIWTHRGLIGSMARRDVLARYRGSFGDVFWTILNPLLLMATYFFVFGIVLQTRFGPDGSRTGFALYFLAGMLPWLAFSEPAGRAPHVVLEHRNFVKKLVFPLETLPIVQTVSGFATGLFATAVYLAGLLLLRHAIPLSVLWLPVLMIPQLLFTLGLCWFLAGLGAYARDLGQIMGFLLTLWFFITPICYPEAQLPAAAVPILKKNPLFVLVHGYRTIFLEGHAPEFHALWKLWLLGIVVFLLGYAWFHRLQRTFADVI